MGVEEEGDAFSNLDTATQQNDLLDIDVDLDEINLRCFAAAG